MKTPKKYNDFTSKIAVLYIINRYGDPIDDEILADIFLNICRVDYFTLKQCQYELEENEFIYRYSADGREFYIITDKGKTSLEFFTSKIPYSMRTEINDCIMNYSPREYMKNNFECFAMPLNDIEYNVKVSYKEGENILLDLTLRAGDEEQAKQLCAVLKKNKSQVYADIYNYIMKLSANTENPPETPKYEDFDEINFFEQ